MKQYLVNKNTDHRGYHEVHTHDCQHRPHVNNSVNLGLHNTCREAINYVKRNYAIYTPADGCYYCSRECHNG